MLLKVPLLRCLDIIYYSNTNTDTSCRPISIVMRIQNSVIVGESGEKWAATGRHLGKLTLIDNLKDAPIFNWIYPYNVTLFNIYFTLFCSIIIRARIRYSKKGSVKMWRNGPYAGETGHSLGRNGPLWGELGHLFNIQFRA